MKYNPSMARIISLLLFFLTTTRFVNSQTTLIVQPSGIDGQDAYVIGSFYESALNYGNDQALIAESKTYKNIYLKFDFSSIPANATIISAKLYLYAFNFANGGHLPDSSAKINFYRVADSWNEDIICWANRPSVLQAPVSMEAPTSSMQNYELDLRNLIQNQVISQIINYGWMIEVSGENLARLSFASSNNLQAHLRPRLEIVYAVCNGPAPPAVISPLSTSTVCKGTLAQLTANSGPGYTYEWRKSGAYFAHGASNTLNVEHSGNYSVLVIDSSGCTSLSPTAIVDVVLDNAGISHHNGKTTPGCINGGLTINATPGNGFQYEWYKDNVLQSFTGSDFVTSQPGFYQCRITSDSCSILSNVIQGLELTATLTTKGPTRFCKGPSQLVAKAEFEFGISTYTWERDGSVVNISVSSPMSYYGADSTGLYKCKISDSHCNAPVYTGSQMLYGNVTPEIKIVSDFANSSPIALCSFNYLYLAHESNGKPYYPDSSDTFQWYYDFGQYIGSQSYVTANQTGSYDVILNTQCGMAFDLVQVLNINDLPLISIPQNSSCDSVYMYIPGEAWKHYQWFYKGVALPGDTFPVCYAKKSGSYSCEITNDCGKKITYSADAILLNNPGVITSSDSFICAGQSKLLTASNSNYASYQWLHNGDSIGTGFQLNAMYPGTYQCIIVTPCDTVFSNQITLSEIPVADRSIETFPLSHPCGSDPVLLQVSSDAGLTYNWYKNNVMINQAVSHSLLVNEHAIYHCVIGNGYGCQVTTDKVNVYANAGKPAITSVPMPACPYQYIMLYSNYFGSYDSIEWYKNGVLMPNSSVLNYYTPPTESYYNFRVVNDCGAFISDTFYVTLRTDSTFLLSHTNPFTLCAPDTMLVTANVANAANIWWTRDGITLANATDPVYTVDKWGLYNMYYKDTITGCLKKSNDLQVLPPAGELYKVEIPGGVNAACDSLLLSVNAEPGDSVQWLLNDIAMQGKTNDTLYATSTGYYRVNITNSCNSAQTAKVYAIVDTGLINPQSVTLYELQPNSCSYPGSKLSLNMWWGVRIDSIEWFRNGISVQQSSIQSGFTATESGVYTASVENACGVSPAGDSLNLTIQKAPETHIAASGSIEFCNDSVLLFVTDSNIYSYQWLRNGSEIVGAVNSGYFASKTGSYTCRISSSDCNVVSDHINVVNQTSQSAVLTTDGISKLCADSSVILYSFPADSGSNYEWYKGHTLIATTGSNQFTVSDPGNYSCRILGTCGQLTTNPLQVHDNRLPRIPPKITGPDVPCSNYQQSFIYEVPYMHGFNYIWTVPPGSWINSGAGTRRIGLSFNPMFQGGYLTVKLQSPCGNSIERKRFLGISKPPKPVITTSYQYGNCNRQRSFHANYLGQGIIYSWTMPEHATLISGQGTKGIQVAFDSLFTSGYLKVKTVNNCSESDEDSVMLFSTPATPQPITGLTTICAYHSNVFYSVPVVEGASSYHWIVPQGVIIKQGADTNKILVDFTTYGGQVRVAAENACGSSGYRRMNVAMVCRDMDEEISDDISVYPNPSSSGFRLSIPEETDHYELVLTDLSGRIIMREKVASTSFEFGENLDAGSYMVHVVTGGMRKVVLIVKQ